MSKPACDPAEIVGVGHIAAWLGVATATVEGWQKRARTAVRAEPFPRPDGYVGRHGRTPWWFWTATIVPWARKTGRLPR